MSKQRGQAAVTIRPFTMAEYPAVIELWERCEGIGLSAADEAPAIAAYLARNPDMSFVAWTDAGQVAGAVLCGHDGRRGYIHHLAVDAAYRRQGVGQELVEHCLAALAGAQIQKCHLFIFHDNETGKAFWQEIGWTLRQDIQIMSRNLNDLME
jgi:putative acetyltransferase